MPWGVASAVIGAVGANAAAKKSAKATDAATYAANTQADIALDQWDSFKEIYQPIERSIATQALQAGTDEDLARAAGEASTTVSSQYGKARDRLARTPGADPSSGAFQAGLVGLELSQAAADATAQNKARQTAKDTAFAKQVDAASIGKGLPAQAMSGLSSAASAQSAVASQQSASANNTAAGLGNLVGNIGNAFSKSGGLGNVVNNAQAGFSQTGLGSSGFGSGLAYGNQDLGLNF